MRAAWLMVVLAGCGPVLLGEEEGVLDGGTTVGIDAAAEGPQAEVTLSTTSGCGACVSLLARGLGGRPPYTFEWQDGSHDAERKVCPDAGPEPMLVVVRDALGRSSPPHRARLSGADASCPVAPPPPSLCLLNQSFEGVPGVNSNVAPQFDVSPWSTCMAVPPPAGNTPDVVNDTIPQVVTFVPKATEGATFLGLMEGEQASQRLCSALSGGTEVSFRVDLGRIYLGGGVPDTEPGFLEVWGGVAADCSQRELLWASPALSTQWNQYCVTLRPQQFTDNLTLRARSDNSLGTAIYLTVDHIVPVSRCP